MCAYVLLGELIDLLEMIILSFCNRKRSFPLQKIKTGYKFRNGLICDCCNVEVNLSMLYHAEACLLNEKS